MINNCHTYNLSDVVESVGYDADASTILKVIIENFYENIANTIRDNKVAKIPYIGNVRKNLVKQEFSSIKRKVNLRNLRNAIGKEKYKETVKNYYKTAINNAQRLDRIRVLTRQNIANNREKYDRLRATAGEIYAKAYIVSICLMEPVEATPLPQVKSNIKFKFKK